MIILNNTTIINKIKTPFEEKYGSWDIIPVKKSKGGMMKKKGMAKGGMKKKGYAAGGLKMVKNKEAQHAKTFSY